MIGRICLLLAVLLLGGAGLRDRFDAWVDETRLPPLIAETGTEIRDRNGELLRAFTVGNGLWRLDIRPKEVDPVYLSALLRIEDKRFARHAGIDILALMRAGAQMLRHGRAVSGASTVSMQVARLIEDGSTGRWSGKLRQIRVALALERRLDKNAILRLYLLHAPYGGNIEGIRAASLAWFGKEPSRLNPAEVALLIALPQAPEARRPDRNPGVALIARNRVVDRLQEAGLLSDEAARSARVASLPDRMRNFPIDAPHLGAELQRAYPGRLTHDLSIGRRVQRAMQDLSVQAVRGSAHGVSAAILVADHGTGEILASVGSPWLDAAEGRQGFVDMTRALRSPGSTLKPLVYALGFDAGLVHPETLIADSPVSFDGYAPQNFDGRFRGEIRVREALQQSLNIPVVRLTRELGPSRLLDAMRKAGTQPVVPGGRPGLALSLGGVGLSLRDLVQIHAMLARGGVSVALHHHRGLASDNGVRVVSRSAAWQVGDILAGLSPPPGASPGLAYKTGTSYGHRDAWAVGWDGRHVVGVWLGRPDGTPVPGAFGGEMAAPILFEAFGRLKTVPDALPPPPPETLTVASAMLPRPLQRFRPRDALFGPPGAAPRVVFPPDGARMEGGDAPLVIKLQGGRPPFTMLANGRPVGQARHGAELHLPRPGRGFSELVVIDAAGLSDRVRVWMD